MCGEVQVRQENFGLFLFFCVVILFSKTQIPINTHMSIVDLGILLCVQCRHYLFTEVFLGNFASIIVDSNGACEIDTGNNRPNAIRT